MQKQKPAIFSKKAVISIYLILLLLFVIGTFADLDINNFLYHPKSMFARIVFNVGLYPIVLASYASFGVFLKLVVKNYRDVLSDICLIWNGFVLEQTAKVFYRHYVVSPSLSLGLTLILSTLLAAALAAYIYRKVDVSSDEAAYRAKRAALVILFAVSLQYLLIGKVLKVYWGRPRYRTLIVTEGMDFRPWYLAGVTELARALMASGIPAEEFLSFPSGHAGSGSCILFLVFLPSIVPALKKKEKIFTIVSLVWIALTMLGRMIAGAHFLTDVTMGVCITWTAFLLGTKLFYEKKSDEKQA